VTGATSGIGFATALKCYRDEGACVFATGRNEERLTELSKSLSDDSSTGRFAAMKADVEKESEVKKAVDVCLKMFGKIDCLVNSAGVIKGATADVADVENLDLHYRVNVRGTFAFMSACIPYLKKTRGSIVNVSSVNGQQSFAGCFSYCTSKAAVDMMTECAALDLAKFGVRVNSVNPGVTRTELHRRGGKTDEQYKAFLERCKQTHPIGRIAEPEEIADAIIYLASSKAGFVTGTHLMLDGGRSCLGAR